MELIPSGVHWFPGQVPKGLVLAASFREKVSMARVIVAERTHSFAFFSVVRRRGLQGKLENVSHSSFTTKKKCVKNSTTLVGPMHSLVENKKPNPRFILYIIIVIMIVSLKTPLSGDLRAKVFLLV